MYHMLKSAAFAALYYKPKLTAAFAALKDKNL